MLSPTKKIFSFDHKGKRPTFSKFGNILLGFEFIYLFFSSFNSFFSLLPTNDSYSLMRKRRRSEIGPKAFSKKNPDQQKKNSKNEKFSRNWNFWIKENYTSIDKICIPSASQKSKVNFLRAQKFASKINEESYPKLLIKMFLFSFVP